MLGNFVYFCILLNFPKLTFFKTLFQDYHQKVNQLDDFGPNCKWFNNQTRSGSRISGKGVRMYSVGFA